MAILYIIGRKTGIGKTAYARITVAGAFGSGMKYFFVCYQHLAGTVSIQVLADNTICGAGFI
jgi:hypothetical protein